MYSRSSPSVFSLGPPAADWPAVQLLTRHGATEERLRAEILRVLKQG